MWCTKQPTLKFIPMHAAQYQHCILKHLLASDRSAVAVSFALVPSSRSHIRGAQPPCHHIPLRQPIKPAIDPSRQFLHPTPPRVPLCLPCIRRSGVLLPPLPSSLVPRPSPLLPLPSSLLHPRATVSSSTPLQLGDLATLYSCALSLSPPLPSPALRLISPAHPPPHHLSPPSHHTA